MSARGSGLWLVGLSAVAWGCGSAPPTHVYTLTAPRLAATTEDVGNPHPAVGVTDFRVDAPYDQSRIVYRIGEDSHELRFYAYHRWAEPLSQELPRATAESLCALFGQRAFEPVQPGRSYQAVLSGRLLQLEEVTLADGVQARLGFELELRSAAGEILWAKRLAAANRVARGELASVAELVRLLRRTLDDALAQDLEGLRAALEASLP